MSRREPSLFRVLVADGEVMARRRLVRLLGELARVEPFEQLEIAGECADGADVLARVRAGGIDAVFLDIQMPGLTGLEASALFPPDPPVVISCAAHEGHAMAAFDLGAVDYLLKPIDAARLKRALERATGRAREARRTTGGAVDASAPRPAHPIEALARLPLSTREGIVLLDPEGISHAVLGGALVTVVAARGEFLCNMPIQELEARLAGAGFFRVHRRALVNLRHVDRLEPSATGGFVARMRGGHAVEVSRQAARELRRRLGIR